MATYSVRQGEGISDCTLNFSGNIANWESLITSNFFPTWTPSLYSGQILQTPDNANINQTNLSDLTLYPANNASVPDIEAQIFAIFAILQTATPIHTDVTTITAAVIDTNTYYTVRVTETVSDSILNGSGDIENWDVISAENFWSSWTPTLFAGEQVAIPITANMNLNNFRALNTYPANNHSVPDIYEQIFAIFETLNSNDWILFTTFWRDLGYWRDSSVWQD